MKSVGRTHNSFSTLSAYSYDTTSSMRLQSVEKNLINDVPQVSLNFTYNEWNKTDTRTEQFSPTDKITEFNYDYSQAWHLIGKDFVHETHRREAYTYDSLYRLRRVDYDCDDPNDPTCIENRSDRFSCETGEQDCDSFTLDGVQNIRTSKESGPWNNGQEDYTWSVDGLNRLTQKSDGTNTLTYLYDAQNNLVSESDGTTTTTYLYDDLNRLILWNSGTREVKYTYDAFNRRISKEISEGVFTEEHSYAYHGWDIYQETITTSEEINGVDEVEKIVTNRYIDVGMDNHIVMMKHTDYTDPATPDSDEEYWFHKDERGNVIAVTDGNSTVLQRYRYSVYGEVAIIAGDTTELISPFLWGGSLYEPETGLYWMRNRYYNTGMKRFINQDPIGIWGDANNLGNGFAYVGGMVVEASDPTGLNILIVIKRTGVEGGVMKSTIHVKEDAYGVDDLFSGVSQETIMSKGIVTAREYDNVTIRTDSGSTGKKKWRLQFIPQKRIDNWSLVQIHRGSKKKDSTGCTIVGNQRGQDNGSPSISSYNDSINAMNTIQNIIEQDGGNITISVENQDRDLVASGTVTLDDGTKLDYNEYINSDESTTVEYSDGTVVQFNVAGDKKTVLKKGKKYKELVASGLAHPVPSDDSLFEKMQVYFMQQMLLKILNREPSDDQPSVFRDASTGPNGAMLFYKNPYYRKKEPMQSIFIDGNDGSGRPIIMRNPMSAPANYIPWNSTAERWMQSPFNPGNIDPYFE